jgi:G protein-coupled receptor Mth (Methuselah protein)
VIYTVCGGLSLFFLLLTILLYLKLPELDNFQGEITTIYLCSIFLTTFLLTISYSVRLKAEDPAYDLEHFIFVTKNVCAMLGYLIYFSALLMFCWMSALSFDLFWSFSYTSVPLIDQNNKLKQICYYSFGFGIPFIMTSIIISLDLVDGTSKIIVPGVGEDRCFLSFQGARYFFYIPMSVLLCTNLIFYFTTLFSLCKSHRSTHIASRQRRNPRIEVSKLTVIF